MSSETGVDWRPTATLTPSGPFAGALPSPGDWIAGRYELHTELGRGGHGVVFEAFDHELQRLVALKLLREDRVSEERVRRFRREAALARDVQHPHLVRVFDLGLAGELLFIVMEKVAGPTLARRVAEEGRLGIDDVRVIAAQLLEALAELHRAGIIHRDVKPSNVLLESASDGTIAKLGDLGVARRLDPEETRVTIDDRLVGTLAYLPPEIAAGQSATQRSDLYALGLTLLDTLVGIDFQDQGDALARVLRLHRKAPSPETLRAQRPDLPRWLAEWLARLLEPDPERRYPSAGRALDDLLRRRSPAFGVRRIRGVAVAVLAVSAAVGAWFVADRLRPRFHGLRPAVGGGVEAFDAEGRTLWMEPRADADLIDQIPRVRIDRRGWPVLALLPYSSASPVGTREPVALTMLDPDDGEVVRRVPLDLRHASEGLFSYFSRSYVPHGLQSIDLDADGVDEVVIVLNHVPSWPSIVLLYEPTIDRARTVFLGSGHQRYLAAFDLDGDGRRELLFSGYSSILRRVRTLTAVSLDPAVNSGTPMSDLGPASSAELAARRNLLWQVVVEPRGVDFVEMDSTSEHLILHSTDRILGRLRFDGSDTLAPLVEPLRKESLQSAYTHFREMLRLVRLGAWNLAAGEASAAMPLARDGGDPRLAEVAARFEAIHRIRAGEVDLGSQQLEFLWHRSAEASSIAYDAAEALHLSGRLGPAVDWYRRAALRGGEPDVGREKRDITLFLVLALIEQSRFAEIETDIRRFQISYGWRDDHEIPAVLRSFARLAQRDPIAKLAPVAIPSIENGRELYLLALELSRAAGAPPEAVLAELDRALPLISGSRGTFLALRASLLAELGRESEARVAALESARHVDPEHDLLDYAFRHQNSERTAALGGAPSDD